MIERRLRFTLPFLALVLALPLSRVLLQGPALAAPQDGGGDGKDGEKKDGEKKDEPKADPAPSEDEVKEFTKNFEDSLKKMTDEDAIAGVEKMRAWWVHPGFPEDMKKDLLGTMKKVCDQSKRESLLEAAAKALGDFGEDGLGLIRYVTQRAFGQKPPPPGVVRAGLAAMGKIASPKDNDVKFLTELLKKDDEFIGDAARALAGYAKAPGAVRRNIFEEFLKMSEGVFSKSEANDQPAKRRWNIWGTEVVEAMQKVSKTNWTKPPEFRKWFNDKGEGGGKNPRTWADAPSDGK